MGIGIWNISSGITGVTLWNKTCIATNLYLVEASDLEPLALTVPTDVRCARSVQILWPTVWLFNAKDLTFFYPR